MRRACLFLTAALLVLAGGAARADDKPTGVGSSAPGAPPSTGGTEPSATGTVDVEKVVLRVNGKTVEAAPPAVTVEITIGLRNFSSKRVDNVKLHLYPSDGGRVTDADATYGDIAAGDGADGVFALVIDRDPCPEFFGLAGEISFDGGTSVLKIGIATACPGPRLSIENVSYTGGDGDGVPEPGESLHAFIVLRNDGHDAARSVRGTVKFSGKGVSSSSDTVAWPDIAPGESEKSKTGVALSIADEAPRQDGCPGLPRDGGPVIPPEEGGTVPPDATVSSDGSVSSDGNTSTQPGSAPGSAGSGAGSEPTQVEPVPPSTATAAPEPGAIVEPAPGTGTVEPQPGTIEPDPGVGTPVPLPEKTAPSQDRPAEVQLQMDATATGYTAALEYSNQTFCAYEGGLAAPAVDDAAKRSLASGTSGASGSNAFPIAMTLLLSAGAVAARFTLVR